MTARQQAEQLVDKYVPGHSICFDRIGMIAAIEWVIGDAVERGRRDAQWEDHNAEVASWKPTGTLTGNNHK